MPQGAVWAVGMAVGLAATTAAAGDLPPEKPTVQFHVVYDTKVQMIGQNDSGPVRFWVAGDSVRVEFPAKPGTPIVIKTIGREAINFEPADPAKTAVRYPYGDFIVTDALEQGWGSLRAKGGTPRDDGMTTIAGHPCNKLEFPGLLICVTAEGILLQLGYADAVSKITATATELGIGPQDSALFNIPEGFVVKDAQAN
jgi:hypothetical protein